MIRSDRRANSSGSPTVPRSAVVQEQPLRFLLIRTRSGELPWLAQAMAHLMAPVEIVQVVGMANALWRLGQERFDSVLLDVDVADRRVIRRCREQIADVAVVPVLDLADQSEATLEQAAQARQSKQRETITDRQPARQTMRLPWERRPKRQMSTAQGKVTAAG